MPRTSLVGSIVALILVLGSIACVEYYRNRHVEHQAAVNIEDFPEQFSNWRLESIGGLDVRSKEILQLDHYIRRSYSRPDEPGIYLYVGYWTNQTGEHQAAKHSPRLCLPANGWTVHDQATHRLEVGAKELTVKSLIGETRQGLTLFYYWFFTGERTYHQDWKALFYISLENFLHGRSDGGIIEIATPITTSNTGETPLEAAHSRLQSFLADFVPEFDLLISEALQG